MFEELSVFDSEPNDEIEMCNGTAINTGTEEEGKDARPDIFTGLNVSTYFF